MVPTAPHLPSRVLGRYVMYEHFAAGGMATLHYGRLLGPSGFSRAVAIKRLHTHLATDPEFVEMFLDEARLAARIQHPNVIQTLDVASSEGELFVVLDYVHGHSLAHLLRESQSKSAPATPALVGTILFGALEGLHAAHEARDGSGVLLDVVHRDVSPQNVMVGTDGNIRVLDFGVAKARGRSQTTQQGQLKGKLSYMAPEQLRGQVTRRTDVFAAAVVLWEALTGRRLFAGADEGEVVGKLLHAPMPSPRAFSPLVSPQLESVVMRGLERDPSRRYATAREMAVALQDAAALATPIEVGAWVQRVAGADLAIRAARVSAIEAECGSTPGAEPSRPTPPAVISPPSAHDAAAADLAGATEPIGLAVHPRVETTSTATQSMSADIATIPDRRLLGTTPGRAIRVALGVAAAAAILLLARAGLHASSAPPVTASQVGATLVPALDPAASATAESASSATPAATVAVVAASPEPPASGAVAQATVAASLPAPQSKARPASSPHKREGHAAHADCTTAYTIDEKGMRHYKPECI